MREKKGRHCSAIKTLPSVLKLNQCYISRKMGLGHMPCLTVARNYGCLITQIVKPAGEKLNVDQLTYH